MDQQANPQHRWVRTLVFLAVFICLSTWAIHIENQGGLDSLGESFQAPPNFSEFDSTKERKKAFFELLEPLIEAENQTILKDREYLNSLIKKERLSNSEQTWLETQYHSYRVKEQTPAALAKSVDTIPTSLALAQAAIESAWGTSRFAQQANNFYGQWCFKEGCGLVPNERKANSSHEVKKFSTADLSVASYIRNLNSHPAYAKLRELRSEAANANQPYSGCVLAQGLEDYSERGMDYVNSVRTVIRGNKLESNTNGLCDPIPTVADASNASTGSSTEIESTTSKEETTTVEKTDESTEEDQVDTEESDTNLSEKSDVNQSS